MTEAESFGVGSLIDWWWLSVCVVARPLDLSFTPFSFLLLFRRSKSASSIQGERVGSSDLPANEVKQAQVNSYWNYDITVTMIRNIYQTPNPQPQTAPQPCFFVFYLNTDDMIQSCFQSQTSHRRLCFWISFWHKHWQFFCLKKQWRKQEIKH